MSRFLALEGSSQRSMKPSESAAQACAGATLKSPHAAELLSTFYPHDVNTRDMVTQSLRSEKRAYNVRAVSFFYVVFSH